ncbi:Cna B-type domain-containing protein, partial [Brevibacterium paucivorans]
MQLIRKKGEESTPVGDKVELSAAGGWKHTFEKLPTVIDEEPVT